MNNRGGRPHRPPRDPDHPNVPPISRLQPGTPVAIILKVDQPSGHRVHGIVSELLTRGDHPRGVKVRLTDGRVGRVQSVVEESKGREGEGAAGGAGANLGRDGLGGRRAFGHAQDVRGDGYLWDEEAPREYFADVQFKVKGKKGKRGGGGASRTEVEGEVGGEGNMASCPVCGGFEGDERAVAHHVEQHFG